MVELGERLGAKVVSHVRYIPFQMAEVTMSRQMFADTLSPIARLRAPPSPAGAALGVRCEATREEVCLYAAKTARSVPQLSSWRFDRLPGTESLISPCSGRLSERSWSHDCRNIRRMSVQLGFALLSPCVRAVVFSTRMVEGGR